MSKRSSRIWSFFAIIFVVFGGATAYLMFFQVGLDLEGKVDLNTGKLNVNVINESFHVIKDINVSYLDSSQVKQPLGEQQVTLKPFEKISLDLNKDQSVNGEIKVVIEAPYHLGSTHTITVKQLGIAEVTEEVIGPTKAFTGSSTTLTVKICNQGKTLENLTVAPLYNTSFFQNQINAVTTRLPENACVEVPFIFVGQKSGQTAIIFNISADSLSKRVKKDLEIVSGAT